jgi:hypothetical protein
MAQDSRTIEVTTYILSRASPSTDSGLPSTKTVSAETKRCVLVAVLHFLCPSRPQALELSGRSVGAASSKMSGSGGPVIILQGKASTLLTATSARRQEQNKNNNFCSQDSTTASLPLKLSIYCHEFSFGRSHHVELVLLQCGCSCTNSLR